MYDFINTVEQARNMVAAGKWTVSQFMKYMDQGFVPQQEIPILRQVISHPRQEEKCSGRCCDCPVLTCKNNHNYQIHGDIKKSCHQEKIPPIPQRQARLFHVTKRPKKYLKYSLVACKELDKAGANNMNNKGPFDCSHDCGEKQHEKDRHAHVRRNDTFLSYRITSIFVFLRTKSCSILQ